MLNVITTLLEIAGSVVLVIALALAAATLTPEPWDLTAGLGTLGIGLVALSFALTRTARR